MSDYDKTKAVFLVDSGSTYHMAEAKGEARVPGLIGVYEKGKGTQAVVMHPGLKTGRNSHSMMDINSYHRQHGHLGETRLRQLAKWLGTKLTGQLVHCDPCARGKSKLSLLKGEQATCPPAGDNTQRRSVSYVMTKLKAYMPSPPAQKQNIGEINS